MLPSVYLGCLPMCCPLRQKNKHYWLTQCFIHASGMLNYHISQMRLNNRRNSRKGKRSNNCTTAVQHGDGAHPLTLALKRRGDRVSGMGGKYIYKEDKHHCSGHDWARRSAGKVPQPGTGSRTHSFPHKDARGTMSSLHLELCQSCDS